AARDAAGAEARASALEIGVGRGGIAARLEIGREPCGGVAAVGEKWAGHRPGAEVGAELVALRRRQIADPLVGRNAGRDRLTEARRAATAAAPGCDRDRHADCEAFDSS